MTPTQAPDIAGLVAELRAVRADIMVYNPIRKLCERAADALESTSRSMVVTDEMVERAAIALFADDYLGGEWKGEMPDDVRAGRQRLWAEHSAHDYRSDREDCATLHCGRDTYRSMARIALTAALSLPQLEGEAK